MLVVVRSRVVVVHGSTEICGTNREPGKTVLLPAAAPQQLDNAFLQSRIQLREHGGDAIREGPAEARKGLQFCFRVFGSDRRPLD